MAKKRSSKKKATPKKATKKKRSPTYKGERRQVLVRLKVETIANLDARAAEVGLSRNELAERLLSIAATTEVTESGGLFVGGFEELIEDVLRRTIEREAERGRLIKRRR